MAWPLLSSNCTETPERLVSPATCTPSAFWSRNTWPLSEPTACTVVVVVATVLKLSTEETGTVSSTAGVETACSSWP